MLKNKGGVEKEVPEEAHRVKAACFFVLRQKEQRREEATGGKWLEGLRKTQLEAEMRSC